MSDKYTLREGAVKTYFQGLDDDDKYYISTKMSEANGMVGRENVLLIKMGNGDPLGVMNNNEQAGYELQYQIVGVPVATDDDEADTMRNEILEFVEKGIRATRAYPVFSALADGHALGWRMGGFRKGVNSDNIPVIEIDLFVSFEED